MKRSWPIPVMVLLLLAGLGGSRAAHSDDWPQFRRDSSRSAASLDRIKLPLTEIWSWTTAAEFTRHSPLFHASVWRDRVFFVAADGNTRYLVCANAKTGAVIWRQAMAARRMPSNHTNTVGPVVSKDGVVFVYDHAPILQFNAAAPTFWARGGPEVTRRYQYGSAERNQREWEKQERSSLLGEKLLNNVIPVARNYLAASGLLPTGPLRWSRVVNGVTVERRGKFVSFFQSVAIPSPNAREGEPREAEVVTASLSFDVENAYVVRTFAAANGTPGPVAPLPKTWFEMDVNYLVLHHPPLSHEVRAHRDTLINMGRNYDSNQGGPGYPLLAGNEFAATRGENFFFRWKPLANGIEALPRPTVVDHPLPVPAPFVSEGARFAGFPPVLFSGGFLVGDDMGHRFLTPIDMAATDARSRHWHLDLQNTVGVPASDGKTIYVSLGGPGASRAITAIDGGTGTPFWRYAPGGLSPDPVRREPRDHNPPPPGYFPSRESNVRGMLLPFAGQQVFSLTRPGHWSNPGLVVSGGRIYGEVNGAIVALDQSTGAVVWRHVLPRNAMVRSLVATPDHLLACISPAERTQLAAIVSIDDNGGGHEGNVGLNGRPGVWETIHDDANTLLALRREDGKPVWQDVSLRPGNLSLAGGMVFYANGGLHALGPPERTFRLAIDSTRAEDYAQTTEAAPGEDEAPAAAPEPPAPDAVAPPPAPQKPDPALADATVLRLAWGQPLPQMLEQLRLRREAAPGLPLLLSLDRLNPH
ncbi:MAG TPA: hypothetical protein VK689_02440, partial [Armatimonadota bacterium]|nr:hypothetical protein [Armatimonadota bacterium]